MLFNVGQNSSYQANVQLITRVRPLQATDHVLPSPYFQINPVNGTIVLGNNRVFQLENVLPFDCPQQSIFKNYIEPIVNACFDGFNISVIAYGQTGAGKTFTVFGPGLLYTMNESDFGMVPRTVRHLFYKAEGFPGRQISIQVSYIEIYDEEIHDLLSVEPFHGEISIQEDQNGETVILGATRMECQTIDDVFSCLETGLALRHTGPILNQLSNRSHGIFTLYMQQAWTQDGCMYDVCSKLHFVDLAGSERLGLGMVNVGNEDTHMGGGFQEPFSINSGLLALSNVTSALGDPRRKASCVPYWDSKLTCILKDSLGGNACTLMIVCLSPSASDMQETLNTIQFASRASNICNRPVANVRITSLTNTPFMALATNPTNFVSVEPPRQIFNQLQAVTNLQSSEKAENFYNFQTNVGSDTEDSQTDFHDGEQIDGDEVFKLRFAASQWQLLVANAESLLNELASAGTLGEDTKNKIESWLCLKEEYANCIDPDLLAMKPRATVASDANGNNAACVPASSGVFHSSCESKTLHVIEEVSEPTPTRELSSELSTKNDRLSDDSSSNGSHFAEQLDKLRQHFRETTDRLICSIESVYDNIASFEWNQTNDILNHTNSKARFETTNLLESGRRVSVFGISKKPQQILSGNAEVQQSPSRINDASIETQRDSKKKGLDSIMTFESDPENDGPIEKQPVDLTYSRQLFIRKTNKQLKKAHQEIEALRRAIISKEEMQGIDTDDKDYQSSSFKQAEQNEDEIDSFVETADENLTDIEQNSGTQRRDFVRFENCLKNVAELLDLTANGPRKVGELERSLSALKDQQSELKEQLRQENAEKHELKQEINKDHKRIIELERKLQEQRLSSETRFLEFSCEKDDTARDSELEHKWRWLVAEEERLIELRSAITWRSEELEERQSTLEKKEIALLKSKSQTENNKIQTDASIELEAKRKKETELNSKTVQTSTSSSQKWKLQDVPSMSGNDSISDKEAIRKEIRKLRHTRDLLVQQRQELDERQLKGQELDVAEERRMLEFDEAIEAVDEAIEYKNEVLCNKNCELKCTLENDLLTRLMNLSHAETRSLLCKYFKKVVDLRDGSKKMEQAHADLEAQYEDQSRYCRKLSTALKQAQLNMERRSTTQRRNCEPKIDSIQMDRDFNVERPSHHAHRKLDKMDDDSDYQTNDGFRRQLRDLFGATSKYRTSGNNNGASAAMAVTSEMAQSACSSRTPSLLGLQALHQKVTGFHRSRGRQTGPETTTTVTREKNKLIIKQQPVLPESRETKRRHR